MGRGVLLWALIAACLPLHGVYAEDRDADADDIVILSVKPRSPDVKPIAAPIASQRQDSVAGAPDAKAQPTPAATQISASR